MLKFQARPKLETCNKPSRGFWCTLKLRTAVLSWWEATEKKRGSRRCVALPEVVQVATWFHTRLWSNPDSNPSSATMNRTTSSELLNLSVSWVLFLKNGGNNRTYLIRLWGLKELMKMKVLRSWHIANNILVGRQFSWVSCASAHLASKASTTLLFQAASARRFVYKQPWKIETMSPPGARSSRAYCPV